MSNADETVLDEALTAAQEQFVETVDAEEWARTLARADLDEDLWGTESGPDYAMDDDDPDDILPEGFFG